MKYINEELLDRYLDKFVYSNIENNTANDSSYLISEDKGVKSFFDPRYFVLRTKQDDGRYKLPDLGQYYFKGNDGKYYSTNDDGRIVYNVEKRPNKYSYSSISTEQALFDIMEKCENYAGMWAFRHNIDCMLKPDINSLEGTASKECFWGDYCLKESYYDNYHLFYITGLFSFPLLSCLRVSNHQVNHVRWWETHSMANMHTDCCLDIIIGEEMKEPFNPSPSSDMCEKIDVNNKGWKPAVVVSIDIRYKNPDPNQNSDKNVDDFIAKIINSGYNRPTFKIDDIINIFSKVADISFIMSYDGVAYKYDCNSRQWTSIVEDTYPKDKDGDYSISTLNANKEKWIYRGQGKPLNQTSLSQTGQILEVPFFSKIMPEKDIMVPILDPITRMEKEAPIDKVIEDRTRLLSERRGQTEITTGITNFNQVTVFYTLKKPEKDRIDNLQAIERPISNNELEKRKQASAQLNPNLYPDITFFEKYDRVDKTLNSPDGKGHKVNVMQLKGNADDENPQFIAVDSTGVFYDDNNERFYFKSYPVATKEEYDKKIKDNVVRYGCVNKSMKCFITLRSDYYREPSIDEFWENRIQGDSIGGYTREDVYTVYMPKENAPYYVKDIGPILAVEDETGNDFLYFPAKCPNQKCIIINKKELYEITFKDIVNMVNECLKKLL